MEPASEFAYCSVGSIPEQLDPGMLYHSERFALASHLCACGCGFEAVTRIEPQWYTLQVSDGKPTLSPSIGNASFPCRSHYFIRRGRVAWAGEYTPEMIAVARRLDNPRAHPVSVPLYRRLLARLRTWLVQIFRK